jgi:hypothetical protein
VFGDERNKEREWGKIIEKKDNLYCWEIA